MKNLMSRIMLVRSFAVFCFLLGPVWPVTPVPATALALGDKSAQCIRLHRVQSLGHEWPKLPSAALTRQNSRWDADLLRICVPAIPA